MSVVFCILSLAVVGDAPEYLEDRFALPQGFRIYKAAGRDECGGSYDIAFDGEGRLLVGDGKRVRRLIDSDDNGVFDGHEVIADGLGGRGPQGLAVVGDRLFAVGGDGVQLFEGYRSKKGLVHKGRVGAPFRTGGDHDAHTIFRGHDDYLYFITGDGGGAKDRVHITEESSPARKERGCSVFRISPDGKRWECIGTGGRNAPNLGMNDLGDLFSLDSDMEWHVALPWWRPVRLHHWITGGDQGWQGVGAYPPYYIDCLPGIHDVGRGSPDWGVVYEHTQFPARYDGAFLVCDYRWKSATTGGYETAGRVLAFFFARRGAGWDVTHEVFAAPKPGARDAQGRPIDFAVVDAEVGPDGSVYVSDHGQGVWRIFFDPDAASPRGAAPRIAPPRAPLARNPAQLLKDLLALPQPGSERSRLDRERLRQAMGPAWLPALSAVVTEPARKLSQRLRALRYLSADFAALPDSFLRRLAGDAAPELRGQAAWLMGLQGTAEGARYLAEHLVRDPEPFVRRRALEALCRNRPPASLLPAVIEALEDPVRQVRYTAMVALTHHPREAWFRDATSGAGVRSRMRALIAADVREEPPEAATVRTLVGGLSGEITAGSRKEDRLDLLRVLGRFRAVLENDAATRGRIREHLVSLFPDPDPDIRREQARLLGEYRMPAGFAGLLDALEKEKEPVAQFHLAQALARIPEGWSDDEEGRAVDWFLQAQRGWFDELNGKGLQFPQFWATVLAEFARHHGARLMASIGEIDLAGQLGNVVLERLGDSPQGAERLIRLYRANKEPAVRVRLVEALGNVRGPEVSRFLRDEFPFVRDTKLQGALLKSLARQPPLEANRDILAEGLLHDDSAVIRAAAIALCGFRPDLDEDLCQTILSRMSERRDVFRACEKLLVARSGRRRDGYDPGANRRRRLSEAERRSALAFWSAWYKEQFGVEFRPLGDEAVEEKSNEEVLAFLLSEDVAGGNVKQGRKVYEQLCAKCHGGVAETPQDAVIFGPDLTGITRRLTAREIAESLVYPSRVVPDRFKGVTLQPQGGVVLTGFITENDEKHVTLVAQERVYRLPREKIVFIAPQEKSLMPDGLLNRLTLDEIRAVMAYLADLGARQEARK